MDKNNQDTKDCGAYMHNIHVRQEPVGAPNIPNELANNSPAVQRFLAETARQEPFHGMGLGIQDRRVVILDAATFYTSPASRL